MREAFDAILSSRAVGVSLLLPTSSFNSTYAASDSINEEATWELANLASRSPGAAIALALPAQDLGHLFPEALRLDCSTTDPQPVPHGIAQVELQWVTEAEYQIFTRLRPAHSGRTGWAATDGQLGLVVLDALVAGLRRIQSGSSGVGWVVRG